MPERPKRRKNKNKRKNNKGNRSDVNQNNIEGNDATTIPSTCPNTTKDITDDAAKNVEEIYDKNLCEISSSDNAQNLSKFDNVKKCSENNNKNYDSSLSSAYIVETPEQIVKAKPKLDNNLKSKSCDNDDSPTIVEITDDVNVNTEHKCNIPVIEGSNVIITEDETQIKWENVDDFKLPQAELIEGALSSMTIPLSVAHCEQTKTLSPEEESSLRNYLQTLNLSTNSVNINVGDIKTEIEQIINREVKYRLRRKGLAEDNAYLRPGPSRSLAVIDEESGESSKTSRRQSYLSDKKSDNEELEDDVFEIKEHQSIRDERNDAVKNTITSHAAKKSISSHLIPQKFIRVDTKLKEPEISEARGDWTMQTIEKLSGAELVYLTDSSSSTSSLHEANEDIIQSEDNDASVRMMTPTIEVTDTETLLSNTFLANNYGDNKIKKIELQTSEDKSDPQIPDSTKDTGNINSLQTDLIAKENSHEIVVLSTDNLKTNLIVKDVEENAENYQLKRSSKPPKEIDEYDLEIKVLKCELNDAINNLIKEVTSDSENGNDNIKDSLKRQDSSSSIDSSQCTAKYNPTHSSLNDVSNLIQESDNKENSENISGSSHVKEVINSIASKISSNHEDISKKFRYPHTLRDICLQKITTLPFGDKILEELANVSQRLQNSVLTSQYKKVLTTDQSNDCDKKKPLLLKESNQIPPPVYPRKSSLRKAQDEQSKPMLPSRTEIVYECLSPSQKMLMEKTNTVIVKEDIPQKNDKFSVKANLMNNNENKLDMKSETGSRLLAFLRDTSNFPKYSSSPIINTKNEKQSSNLPFVARSHSITNHAQELMDEIDSAEVQFNNKNYFLTKSNKPLIPPKPTSSYFYESDSGIRNNSFEIRSPSKQNTSSYSYESDSGIRENTFHTLSSNKRYFHYSTGNLNKEIESDISSIQNMHRYCTDLRDRKIEDITPRRPSLPKDLCDQQMEYIRQKEREVDAEIRRLEKENRKVSYGGGPRAPMIMKDDEKNYNLRFDLPKINYTKKNYVPMYPSTVNVEKRKMSSLFSSSEEELLREKMYSEYVHQMAEREHRKQHKVIKVTTTPIHSNIISKSMPAMENLSSKSNNRIEEEFISKAKERWYKLGITDPETEDERENGNNIYREPRVIEHQIKVIESGEEKDVKKLPNHMQDFVKFTANDKDDKNGDTGESEKTSAHVVVFCAVIILVLTVGKFLLRLFRNQ